jgi:DNA-3-methyladenine glycosylase
MLNIVTEPEDTPAAVLIRAIEPLEGLEQIAQRRPGLRPLEQTNGPARLTQALAINGALNTIDMTTTEAGLWIEPGITIPDQNVRTGARIGLGVRTPEPWFSMALRWWIGGNLYVSVGSGKLG